MKLLWFSLATLLIAVVAAVLAMKDPGYVLIAVGSWTIETTLALVSVVLLLAFVIAYYALRLSARFWSVPADVRQWQQHRRERKAAQALTQGLIDLAEGHWQKAEKHVLQYVEPGSDCLLNYLAAARAAQAQGQEQRRDNYLRLAHENHPAADIAIGLTQAELQLKQHQLEQALATLRHLQQLAPKHGQVLKALARLYRNLADWQHVIEIIPDLYKHKVMNSADIDALQLQAYTALLQRAASGGELKALWSRVPKALQENAAILATYVQALMAVDESDLAEPLLRRALNHGYHQALLQLYGQIASPEPDRQLALVESLLHEHEGDAVALLTAGRLSLRNKLWGKARSYLEASINAGPTMEAYNELGQLLDRMGEREAAAECFRAGLQLAPGCARTTPISMASTSNPAIELTQSPAIVGDEL
jgi:HemY protein